MAGRAAAGVGEPRHRRGAGAGLRGRPPDLCQPGRSFCPAQGGPGPARPAGPARRRSRPRHAGGRADAGLGPRATPQHRHQHPARFGAGHELDHGGCGAGVPGAVVSRRRRRRAEGWRGGRFCRPLLRGALPRADAHHRRRLAGPGRWAGRGAEAGDQPAGPAARRQDRAAAAVARDRSRAGGAAGAGLHRATAAGQKPAARGDEPLDGARP